MAVRLESRRPESSNPEHGWKGESMSVSCYLPGMFVLFLLVMAMSNSTAQGQPAGLKAGDKVEYLDGRGAKKIGEFVELSGTSVRIKLEDGTTRLFNGNRVRLAPGTVTSNPRPPAATGDKPSKPAEAPATESRTWSDATGKFKIEASFVGVENDQVQLKKADGKVISLALSKLSVKDQATAKLLAATAKAPIIKEAPPAEPAVVQMLMVGSPGDETKLSLQDVPLLKLEPPPTWAVVADPAKPPTPSIADQLSTIPLRATFDANGKSSDNYDRAESMIADAAHAWLWIGLYSYDSGTKGSRLERIDVTNGQVMPPLRMPFKLKLICVDPTGRLLATCRAESAIDHDKHIDLWEIDGNELRPYKNFTPGDTDASPVALKQFEWAEFVDRGHLLTLSDKKKLVLWDIETLKAVYQIDLGYGSRCDPTLSPGRHHVVVESNKGVFVLEALTGKVLGHREIKRDFAQVVCVTFSADGSRLAGASGGEFWIWNIADGKVVANISETYMNVDTGYAFSFGSNNHFITGHRCAYDIERGRMSFQMGGYWSSAATFAGREFYVTNGGGGPAKPHKVVHLDLSGDHIAKKAATYTEEELLAIKPGKKISLDYSSLPFEAAEIAKMRDAIKLAFEKNGWKLAAPGEAGDLTLTGTMATAKAKQVEYQSYDLRTTRVMVNSQLLELVLSAPGVEMPVWQSKLNRGPPSHIRLKEGQTPEDAIREEMSIAGFFTHPRIIRRHLKYPQGGSILAGTMAYEGMTVK
jgi:hypothetical protein